MSNDQTPVTRAELQTRRWFNESEIERHVTEICELVIASRIPSPTPPPAEEPPPGVEEDEATVTLDDIRNSPISVEQVVMAEASAKMKPTPAARGAEFDAEKWAEKILLADTKFGIGITLRPHTGESGYVVDEQTSAAAVEYIVRFGRKYIAAALRAAEQHGFDRGRADQHAAKPKVSIGARARAVAAAEELAQNCYDMGFADGRKAPKESPQ